MTKGVLALLIGLVVGFWFGYYAAPEMKVLIPVTNTGKTGGSGMQGAGGTPALEPGTPADPGTPVNSAPPADSAPAKK